ncbi:Tetratricopeptide repeat protein [Trichostrongylus colubriformis]|uniref:Tetratricopeptide repeat protein n=1 Tax=Trichostrongylus colubriformis TaxID=6319 RepID=A0AAN8FTN5_TRICO
MIEISLQLGVWFNAGYCAWKLEHYADAVTCYHRCVSLEPEHFEAWNNLSAAYIKLGQKERARKILLEALKFNFEHPKVWENYLLLCVDTVEFDQAIKAFHRLLDLNKQQKDDQVLDIIASNVLRMVKEASDESSKAQADSLKAELIKLFGRLSSVQTLSSKVRSSKVFFKIYRKDYQI